MENYYEKAFFKLAEQVDKELGWSKDYVKVVEGRDVIDSVYTKGSIFAYESIKRLADKLKAKEYDFEDDAAKERRGL